MNKLKTSFTAGVPFDWDDLDWLQESTRNAFYGLLSAFGINPANSFILSGCVVTLGASSASTTAGYISLNGEILKVDAHSISYDGSSPVVWRLQESNDASGAETDSAGGTVQCYQKRVGVLYQAASYTGEMRYDAQSLSDVISGQLNINTDWVSIPFNAAYFGGSSLVMNSAGTQIGYKVIGKTMFLSLFLSVTSMNSSGLTFYVGAATGYKVKGERYAIGAKSMADNNGPIQFHAQVDPLNNIYITEFGSVALPALSSASLFAEMILEVEPV